MSDLSSSPPQSEKCPICLNFIEQKSVLEGCFHEFCFECIREWSKVNAVCPLCKQNFSIIMHNIVSDSQYDTFKVVQIRATEDEDLSFSISATNIDGLSRFRYRSTMTSESVFFSLNRERHRLQRLRSRMDQLQERQRLRNEEHSLQQSSLAFRKLVYQKGLWAKSLNNVNETTRGEYNVTATFLKANPACTHRLAPWLNRELLAFDKVSRRSPTNTIADSLASILTMVTTFDIASVEFCRRLRPLIGAETRHFAHELLHFARSGMEMENYDACVEYGRPSHAWVGTVVSSESESSGSEITAGLSDRNPDGALSFSGGGSKNERIFLKTEVSDNFRDRSRSNSPSWRNYSNKRISFLRNKNKNHAAFRMPALIPSDSDTKYSDFNIRRSKSSSTEVEFRRNAIVSSKNNHRDSMIKSELECLKESSSTSSGEELQTSFNIFDDDQPSCSSSLRFKQYRNKNFNKKVKLGPFSRTEFKPHHFHSKKTSRPDVFSKYFKCEFEDLCDNLNLAKRSTSTSSRFSADLNSSSVQSNKNDVEIVATEKPWRLRSPISLSSDSDSDSDIKIDKIQKIVSEKFSNNANNMFTDSPQSSRSLDQQNINEKNQKCKYLFNDLNCDNTESDDLSNKIAADSTKKNMQFDSRVFIGRKQNGNNREVLSEKYPLDRKKKLDYYKKIKLNQSKIKNFKTYANQVNSNNANNMNGIRNKMEVSSRVATSNVADSLNFEVPLSPSLSTESLMKNLDEYVDTIKNHVTKTNEIFNLPTCISNGFGVKEINERCNPRRNLVYKNIHDSKDSTRSGCSLISKYFNWDSSDSTDSSELNKFKLIDRHSNHFEDYTDSKGVENDCKRKQQFFNSSEDESETSIICRKKKLSVKSEIGAVKGDMSLKSFFNEPRNKERRGNSGDLDPNDPSDNRINYFEDTKISDNIVFKPKLVSGLTKKIFDPIIGKAGFKRFNDGRRTDKTSSVNNYKSLTGESIKNKSNDNIRSTLGNNFPTTNASNEPRTYNHSEPINFNFERIERHEAMNVVLSSDDDDGASDVQYIPPVPKFSPIKSQRLEDVETTTSSDDKSSHNSNNNNNNNEPVKGGINSNCLTYAKDNLGMKAENDIGQESNAGCSPYLYSLVAWSLIGQSGSRVSLTGQSDTSSSLIGRSLVDDVVRVIDDYVSSNE